MVSSPGPAAPGLLPVGFLTEREVEPVGRWFLSHWDRLQSNRTISAGYLSDSSEDEEDSSYDEDEFEDDIEYLRSLDPKETKDQDHYRVLGLSKLRINATDDQIKRAHRFKVLKHHPDKRKSAGETIRLDDDYFSCITKAYEILGNPIKRRGFDSVDPEFDDDVPDAKKDYKDNFIDIFGPVFERNARWSTKTPVPQLGDADSTREQVDAFYSFWYDLDSWREYSYLDEEDKEKASDKWERREIEKMNRANRADKKKDENKRMRKLVDTAYNSDPRIIRFREEEKQEKLDKKKAKQDAAKARKDEEERLRKEEEDKVRIEKERIEAEEKKNQEAAKKEREAQKKAIKTEKKKLRKVTKDNNMFAENDEESLNHLMEVERLCEILTCEELGVLNSNLAKDPSKGRAVFLDAVNALNSRLEKERGQMVDTGKGSKGEKSVKSGKEWSTEEIQLLIKAVNVFPAGTNQRWEVVSEFINQHTPTPEVQRNAKETLGKAKELQSGNFAVSSLKEEVNKLAYENLEKGKKKDRSDPTESTESKRYDSAAVVQDINTAPWSPEEQKLLEQALKTYPASTPERWDRISESVPNRSKKDCMKRYKELAELIRAKKAAQAAAAKK